MKTYDLVPFLAVACLASEQAPLQRATIKIDFNLRYQTVDGFGVSAAFQRSSDIRGKKGMSPDNTTRILDYLFSNTDGAGLSILRNGIGSSTSTRRDFMNSIAPTSPGSPDLPLTFTWDGNDTDQLWLSQHALNYGVRTIYADAWSAPAYMKSNANDSNGGLLCGVTGSLDACNGSDWRQPYADYLTQYLRFYRDSGVPISHLGFLNEPDLTVYYASMRSDGYQAADFLPILRATLDRGGFPHVQISCCEATGWQTTADMHAEIELAGAADTIDVVAAHGYSSNPGAPLETDAKVWQTEWADLDGDWTQHWDVLGKAGEGLPWANHIQRSLAASNVSAWLYWQGAENTTGNSALISMAPSGAEVRVSKRLWALGAYGRFVKPGSVRVGCESSVGLLFSTAYETPDGGLTLVVINNGHGDWAVEVSVDGWGGNARSVTPWITNNDYNLTAGDVISLDESGWETLVPARSMVTYVLQV